ncbi:MAG: two-component system response regulator [Verrucomicrobia bacterium]|nr:two-component system response regulator [Verrucomicrobiota bacterium]
METKKKILVVEDEPQIRLGLKMRLERNGYEIVEAEDGVAGLSMARTEKPDLIILDIMLPKMDGYQMARMLKFDEKFKSIPIVMLTARSQQTDRDTGQAVGADAYLTKPFKSEELLAAIAKLLPQ